MTSPIPTSEAIPSSTTTTASDQASSAQSERINPNQQWLGVYTPDWLLRRREISHGAKLLYAALCRHFGTAKQGRQQVCNPRQSVLARALGVSTRTIRDYTYELTDHRLIEKRRSGLCRADCYFFLNHDWMHTSEKDWRKPGTRPRFFLATDRQNSAAPERNENAAQDRQCTTSQDRQHDAVTVEMTSAAPVEEVDSEEVDPAEENQRTAPKPPQGDSESHLSTILLTHLNHCAGTDYPATPRTLQLIGQRLNEVGGDVAGVRLMIERQSQLWKGDERMGKFLRPETLFGPVKFGSYYGQRAQPVTAPAAAKVNVSAINSRLTSIQHELRELGDDAAPHTHQKRRALKSEQSRLKELIKSAIQQ